MFKSALRCCHARWPVSSATLPSNFHTYVSCDLPYLCLKSLNKKLSTKMQFILSLKPPSIQQIIFKFERLTKSNFQINKIGRNTRASRRIHCAVRQHGPTCTAAVKDSQTRFVLAQLSIVVAGPCHRYLSSAFILFQLRLSMTTAETNLERTKPLNCKKMGT